MTHFNALALVPAAAAADDYDELIDLNQYPVAQPAPVPAPAVARDAEAAARDMVHDVRRVVGLGHYQVYIKADGTLRYRAAGTGDSAGDDNAQCWSTFAEVPTAHKPGFQRVIDAFRIVAGFLPRTLDAYPWAADTLESIDDSV